MFALVLSALVQALALSLPDPLVSVLGLGAGAVALGAAALAWRMTSAVTVTPFAFTLLLEVARGRRPRLQKAWLRLLIVALVQVVQADRRLPAAERSRSDLDLVLLLGEFVRLQCIAGLAWGPLAPVLVMPVALLLHSRLATARRGYLTVSGSLSALLAAATLPLPVGGHAVAVAVSGRGESLRSPSA